MSSTAIRAKNSKGLKIIDSSFSGFETDIELDNVEDFLSQRNTFSRENQPQVLLNKLAKSIEESNLPPVEKKQLFVQIINLLSQGKPVNNSEKEKLISRVGKYVGNKAVDFLVKLVAAVSAEVLRPR